MTHTIHRKDGPYVCTCCGARGGSAVRFHAGAGDAASDAWLCQTCVITGAAHFGLRVEKANAVPAAVPSPAADTGRTWAVKARGDWVYDDGSRSHPVHTKSLATRFASRTEARAAARRTPNATVVALVFKRKAKP